MQSRGSECKAYAQNTKRFAQSPKRYTRMAKRLLSTYINYEQNIVKI
jgi:hypothetical protein